MDVLATRPAAVVFDVDGLLVDTEPCWTVAETELFALAAEALDAGAAGAEAMAGVVVDALEDPRWSGSTGGDEGAAVSRRRTTGTPEPRAPSWSWSWS